MSTVKKANNYGSADHTPTIPGLQEPLKINKTGTLYLSTKDTVSLAEDETLKGFTRGERADQCRPEQSRPAQGGQSKADGTEQ